jgi:hypothetical protein
MRIELPSNIIEYFAEKGDTTVTANNQQRQGRMRLYVESAEIRFYGGARSCRENIHIGK